MLEYILESRSDAMVILLPAIVSVIAILINIGKKKNWAWKWGSILGIVAVVWFSLDSGATKYLLEKERLKNDSISDLKRDSLLVTISEDLKESRKSDSVSRSVLVKDGYRIEGNKIIPPTVVANQRIEKGGAGIQNTNSTVNGDQQIGNRYYNSERLLTDTEVIEMLRKVKSYDFDIVKIDIKVGISFDVPNQVAEILIRNGYKVAKEPSGLFYEFDGLQYNVSGRELHISIGRMR